MSLPDLNNIKLTPKQTAIAIGLIVVILATLLLRLYFSDKALNLVGPNFIAATDSTALLVYNKKLYRIDEKGQIQQTLSFDDIEIKDKVADIQLLDDKRLVIGDWGNMRILLCELDGVTCKSLTNDLDKRVSDFFKFHYREFENDIFIADTNRHRILRYDTNTHKVYTISQPKQLLYPNHIQFESDNKLYVTDTNHHRIVVFDYIKKKLIQDGNEYRIPKDISENRWPVHYLLADNQDIYILQANDLLRHPELVYLPATGNAKNIPLPPDADITDIRRMQNALLLPDRKQFAIYSLNLQSHEISRFGGENLNDIFTADRKTTEKWEFLADAMLALLVLTFVGIIVFVTFLAMKSKHVKPESVPEANYDLPPITPGKLTWLTPNPFMRRIFLLLIVLLVIISGLFYAIIDLLDIDITNLKEDSTESQLINVIALLAFTFLIVIVNATHSVFSRIGTDGIYIYVKTLFGLNKFTPRNALYTHQYIAKDSNIIAYRNNIQQYFSNKEQFESYITPLLKAYGQETTTFSIIKHMMRNPTKLSIFNALAIGFCCFVFYDMFKSGFLFN